MLKVYLKKKNSLPDCNLSRIIFPVSAKISITATQCPLEQDQNFNCPSLERVSTYRSLSKM